MCKFLPIIRNTDLAQKRIIKRTAPFSLKKANGIMKIITIPVNRYRILKAETVRKV